MQIKIKKISNWLKILNLIFISFLLIFTIFQISWLTQQIYFVKNAEKKLRELSKTNEILEIELSKSNSLSHLEDYLLKENFVKAKNPKYIQILESSVVTK